MNTRGLLAILALLPYLSFAQNISLNAGAPVQAEFYEEISYQTIRNKIIIPVTIEDEDYRFIVDTGAPNLIRRSLAQKLDLPIIKKQTIIDQSGKTGDFEVASLKEVTLGHTTFLNTPTIVAADENILFDCFEIDGFIGSNMLRNAIIKFAAQDQKIILTNQASRLKLRKKESSKMVLNNVQSSPYIDIFYEAKVRVREQVLFDSGMGGFLDIALSSFPDLLNYKSIEIKNQGKGSNSFGLLGLADDTLNYRVYIPQLNINKASFLNVQESSTPDDKSRIGAGLLQYGDVTLDFLNRRFYFEAHQEVNDLKENLFPISMAYDDDKLIVGILWDSAYEAQISSGDQILSINDKDFSEIDLCYAIRSLPSLASFKKDTLSLKLKNKFGEIKTVEIRRNN